MKLRNVLIFVAVLHLPIILMIVHLVTGKPFI